MSARFRELMIEKRSIDYVPIAERHGKVWHLWPVWFSGDAHLATVATGVVGVALGGHLLWMALAVLCGCAFGTFFMAFHSTQGPQLGLPQMIQSRPQFGYVGALLVWGVALIAYIGFNSFNQILAAQTVKSLYGGDATLTMLVFTLLSVSLAVVGYDLIHRAQRYIAYLLIGALLIFTAAVLVRMPVPAAQSAFGEFRAVPFLAQFFAAASYQIAWSIYVSDYSRYLPRDVGVGASFWWTYLGAFVGGTWMMLVGTLSAALYPTLEVATALRTAADAVLPGFGKPLLVCSLFGLVTITSLNYYGASLTLLSVMDSIKPSRPTLGKRLMALLVSTVAATVLALASSENFVTEIRRISCGAAVSVHALDGDQPGRFLRGSQGALLGTRDIQSARHVRTLVRTRPVGLRHRFRCHDSLLQDGSLHRPNGQGAGRGGRRHADRTAGVGARLHSRLPLPRCRGGPPPGACRGFGPGRRRPLKGGMEKGIDGVGDAARARLRRQFLRRNPVLKIQATTARQTQRNPTVIIMLTPTFTSDVP